LVAVEEIPPTSLYDRGAIKRFGAGA